MIERLCFGKFESIIKCVMFLKDTLFFFFCFKVMGVFLVSGSNDVVKIIGKLFVYIYRMFKYGKYLCNYRY